MLVRIGKRGRWKHRSANSESDIAQAALDLTPREGEELSVYKVDSLIEADKVGAIFATTQRNKQPPDPIDIIVLPEEFFSCLDVKYASSEELPLFLNERHYEVQGIQDVQKRKMVAKSLLNSQKVTAKRLTKKEILKLI